LNKLPPEPEQFDRGVQVALAEFGALRAEILNLASGQAALLGVGVPPLAFFICVIRAGESYRVALAGEYIRRVGAR
jgi:hypothetical protein